MRLHQSLALAGIVFAFLDQSPQTPEISTTDAVPVLEEIKSGRYTSGTVIAEINGKKSVFTTTLHVNPFFSNELERASRRERKAMEERGGRVSSGATIYPEPNGLRIVIHAFTDDFNQKGGHPGAAGFRIHFFLQSRSLQLRPKPRMISLYVIDGSQHIENVAKDSNVTFTLDSITRLPNNELALKGSFATTVTRTENGKKLKEPLNIQGTFDIQRMTNSKNER